MSFWRSQGLNIIVSLVAGMVGAGLVVNDALPLDRLTVPASPLGNSSPAATFEPQSEQEARVIATVEKASPAVVSIVITEDVPVIEQYFEEFPRSPFGNFFNPFQFQVPQLRQRGTERREVGGGSGFLASADGLVVTNRHVVSSENADYTVFLQDGTKHEAEVLARDPVNDIAILKINVSDATFLTFGNSDILQVGQSVIAIGNALSEFQNSVSVGVVSGLSRSIIAGSSTGQAEQLDEVIQTDAAINPGNSGGPLLDLAGNVVGVNVAVALGSENIGFALPANAVKRVVESVQTTGRISRPYIGVRYTPITPLLKERNALPVDYGVLIARGETAEDLAIVPGSPANKAGLMEGDIILEIDGQRLDENRSLASAIQKKNVGDSITLKVLQKGAENTVTVTLEEMPE